MMLNGRNHGHQKQSCNKVDLAVEWQMTEGLVCSCESVRDD